MSWVLYLLAVVMLLDAVKMRRRITALPVLAATDAPGAAAHELVVAPGVVLADATRRAASAYAAANDLELLDVIPRDLPALRAMTIATLVERGYREDRLGPGRTAGHAFLVTTALAARAQLVLPTDELGFVRAAARLKHFARGDLAIAPAEHAQPADLSRRLDVLRAQIGPSATVALFALPILWTLIGLGLWLRPVAGLVALAVWHLQPMVALLGTPLRSRDLPLVVLFRTPIELWIWVRTLVGKRSVVADAAAREAGYTKLLAGGTATLLEPRRATCPLCDGTELVVHVRNPDLLQHKPGVFTLEKCGGCGHIFQNPRLSLAGLDFYYKDFYDGLGEQGMEFVFGFGAQPYHKRAQMMRDHAAPKRWLDVGAGHGHFCIAARGQLPDTTFDGLDMSESIDEAKRRGWISTAYRGLFPELAPGFAGAYDAVSMSHYLEHTLDPRAELDAARVALAPGGHLLIEVPDPEYGLAKLLRGYWLPYFQPQHLNLVSVGNLEKLLRERGLEPVEWHRGKAHQRVDFFFAAWMFLDHLAPAPHLPWRPRGTAAWVWRVVAWTLGSPLIIGGVLVDNAIGPLIARGKRGNTYRVLARKTAAPPSD